MGRSRVLSFMSTFGGPQKTSSPSNSPTLPSQQGKPNHIGSPTFISANVTSSISETPVARAPVPGRQRADSRPMSIAGGYIGPQMDTQNTLPELLPIFNCLNSHSNKLYQEGYFLKLNDLDTQGRPYHDRSWTECFAQLVGTVLSLWDAAALDDAGADGEVPATFINLGDASIKMIETLETRSKDAQPLQNVLSISTAGKNRYLLHFSNIHALTQWTAGIRLAMFEHSSLQETYTGALIGGKGRALNNIRTIMTYSKFPTSDWVRVRFGAGTPWRRCWCVISPPDEKEVAKAQKNVKKKSAYDRVKIVLKGDVKFYETKKISKKTQPIATITNAYAGYAIYPQSKPLIEQSTLIKIEGNVTIHTKPETKLESFIFVMPETHEAVTGFEMLLRFLFPIWDVFALYGRPERLIPDTWNPKSLMFAMPKHDRWGYLDILDVTTLVTRPGSANWSEAEWRKEMKKLTAERIEKLSRDPQSMKSRPGSQYGHAHRNSLPSRTAALKFVDEEMPSGSSQDELRPNTTSPAPPPHQYLPKKTHGRSISESAPNSPQPHAARGEDQYPKRLSSQTARQQYSSGEESPPPPPPPAHGHIPAMATVAGHLQGRDSSEDEHVFHDATDAQDHALTRHSEPSYLIDRPQSPVEPVAPPPAFAHSPGSKPQTRPYQSPELRRANSRMSSATLSQLAQAYTANKTPGGSNVEGDGYFGVHDAYNRPNPIPEPNSNLSDPSGNNSTPPVYAPAVNSSRDGSSLQAPARPYRRSPSPLRGVAETIPEGDTQDNSYFIGNPHGPQYDQNVNPDAKSPALTPSYDESRSSRPVSTGAIARKPVPPSPSKQPEEFVSPTSPTDVVRNRDVNDAIVNRMNTIHSTASTNSRRYSGDGSNYESDEESRANSLRQRLPDRSVDKPRVGVRKTVGNGAISDPAGTSHIASSGAGNIPNIDFGPTLLQQPQISAVNNTTSRANASPSRAYNTNQQAMEHNGSPSRTPLPVTDGNHSRSSSYENARTMAWQPGTTVGSSGPSVTPEQFVNQKSAASRGPVYPHTQNQSSTSLQPGHRQESRQSSRTPPLIARHSNPGVPRPSSGSNADPPATDYSRHLSAREQEHVARVTGSPLLGLERNATSPGLPQGGLVGAIEAREQEKKAVREGYGGYMVQQAIAQRQQHQTYRGQEQTLPSPSYAVPGQFPITPQYPPGSWEALQQQRSPYAQGHSGPSYGQQAPQDYYNQGDPHAQHRGRTQQQQQQYQYQGPFGQQTKPPHQGYRD